MSIEKFNNGKLYPFFEELEVRAQLVDLKTSEDTKWIIGSRKENKGITVKDLTHIRIYPALVRELDGNNEESFIAIMETEEDSRFLGYISLGYKGFDNDEALKWTEIVVQDKIVFDLDTKKFVEDPYQSNS